MSDLKHLTIEQLYQRKRSSQTRIKKLGSELSGEKERAKWIDTYISQFASGEVAKERARLLALSQMLGQADINIGSDAPVEVCEHGYYVLARVYIPRELVVGETPDMIDNLEMPVTESKS